jgi:hypothetical protein
MAAAASVVKTRQKNKASSAGCMRFLKRDKAETAEKEMSVSFHLKPLVKPDFKLEGMNSVEFLRLPLYIEPAEISKTSVKSNMKIKKEAAKIAGTIFEVYTKKYSHRDQPILPISIEFSSIRTELLIATEKKIFMVSIPKASDSTKLEETGGLDLSASSGLEIIDSIPLEEVDSIRMYHDGKWKEASDENGLLLWIQNAVSSFFRQCYDPIFAVMEDGADSQSVDTGPEEIELQERFKDDKYCEGWLQIKTTTKRTGFNRGRRYYLMIEKCYYRSTTKLLSEKKPPDAVPGTAEKYDGHLSRVYEKLSTLAKTRQKNFRRGHRFQLLQESLQDVWASMTFNVCVLALIVSNFIFTVQQLENKDQSKQPFYESVDLGYTIIFSIGKPSINHQCLHHTDSLLRQNASIMTDYCGWHVLRIRACLELPRTRTLAIPDW